MFKRGGVKKISLIKLLDCRYGNFSLSIAGIRKVSITAAFDNSLVSNMC